MVKKTETETSIPGREKKMLKKNIKRRQKNDMIEGKWSRDLGRIVRTIDACWQR